MPRKTKKTEKTEKTAAAAIPGEPEPELAPGVSVPILHSLEVPTLIHGSVTISRLDTVITTRQARGLRVLFDGLVANQAEVRLAGSKPSRVESQYDAIRWMLEQVADLAGV